jgi:hypothetical protein
MEFNHLLALMLCGLAFFPLAALLDPQSRKQP